VLALLVVAPCPSSNLAFDKSEESIVVNFINFFGQGRRFVFGKSGAPRRHRPLNPGKEFMFFSRSKALPPILFVSAFFTVLYHLRHFAGISRLMARVMVPPHGHERRERFRLRNVFMGQTEARLIVKP